MHAIYRDFPLALITNNNVLSMSHFDLLSFVLKTILSLEGDFGSSQRWAL